MKLFTAIQLRIVKRHWNGENADKVAYMLDMPVGIVKDKLQKLPANFLDISLQFQDGQLQTTSNRWTPTEEDFLKQNYNSMSEEELVLQLCREWTAIDSKAHTLGLYKRNTQPQYLRSGGMAPKEEVEFKRPPAIYSNRNLREDLLNKYAPLNQ